MRFERQTGEERVEGDEGKIISVQDHQEIGTVNMLKVIQFILHSCKDLPIPFPTSN